MSYTPGFAPEKLNVALTFLAPGIGIDPTLVGVSVSAGLDPCRVNVTVGAGAGAGSRVSDVVKVIVRVTVLVSVDGDALADPANADSVPRPTETMPATPTRARARAKARPGSIGYPCGHDPPASRLAGSATKKIRPKLTTWTANRTRNGQNFLR